MSRNFILLLILPAILSCSEKVVGVRPYCQLYREFPSQAGTYLILTNPASIGRDMMQYYDIKKEKPWPLWPTAGLEESQSKISPDKLRLKGGWYELYWDKKQLYLKLKRNRQMTRDVYVGFLNENDIPCISSLIRQKGEQPNAQGKAQE